MSPRDGEEFGADLLAAKERDLTPLREECVGLLGLDAGQSAAMDALLDSAWFSGMRTGHDQMEARATQPDPDIRAVAIARLESEFKVLMEEAAERLNLTLTETINMWGLLHQAWMAGNRSGEAELMALYVELNTDVAEEVRRWLEERGDSRPG
ncbi:MAG TPA: hypothetical protein VFY48_02860 [Solirubrobacterales bacterium]|nr:hypothetical protein [Solirubrobacterales bacterium]